MMKRLVYGVITAQVSDIEQREILSGIIETAQKLDIDTVVISNIYNPVKPSNVLNAENNIYNLILSDIFDGFILVSESIINPELQKLIINNLKQKSGVPVVAVGTPQPNFTLPYFHFINTNDEHDIEDITDHLIETHKFTDIHILTGHKFIDVSYERVKGYRKSLEKHNIEFDESKVFFGDFWFSSGRAQAEKYINGELEFPQALICCNDYMAYGVLDAFMEHDIKIPESITVTGYEYIRERRNHNPILTTYKRNRKMIGSEAVRLLTEKLKNDRYGDFNAPDGCIIYGDTCSCGARNDDIKREIADIQKKATYDFLNFFSQFEQRLTECCNIDEFVSRCWDFTFMVRDAERIYMCLYENWYNEETNSENIIRYNLTQYEEPAFFQKNQFSLLFCKDAGAYYMCPLFFEKRELGFIVLRYDKPDSYDYIFRNILKSVSNNLEFLRMKNDIKYLLHCQNIAENRDTLTNMLNEKGFRNAFQSAKKNNNICFVGLRVCLFNEKYSATNHNIKIKSITDIAECIHQFCGTSGICAKVDNDTFFCLINNTASPEILSECLESVLCQHKEYMQYYGMDSFVCCAFRCQEMTYSQVLEKCRYEFEQKINIISAQKSIKNYKTLISLRTEIYMKSHKISDSNEIIRYYDGSLGHLRRIYKNCFGKTFHQDYISARIARARYFLVTTSMNIADIACYCGYSDNKYFMRQFVQETGMKATQYRMLFQKM